MDPAQPLAEAMLVEGNRIAAVGRYADLAAAVGESGEQVDLKGRALLPGFNDAHIHIWKVGHLLTSMLDLRGVQSIRELQERLEAFSQNYNGKWIIGRGFNEVSMMEKRLPERSDIDAVVSDRPVFLIRTCAHIGIANSRALRISGVTSNIQAPAGGLIDLGDRGKPNGILAETAMGLVMKHIPPPGPDDYRQMIRIAGKAMLKHGITSATDPAVMPDLMAVYRQMAADRELPLRVNTLGIRLPDGGDKPLPLPEKQVTEWFRSDSIKFFADGGLSGRTAALSKPYRNSDYHGVLRLEPEQFFKLSAEAHRRGYRIGTHAIGDRAIDLVLSVYERLYRDAEQGKKHRIEHLGLPGRQQLERMATMGLHAVPQSIFLRELGANFRAYIDEEYLQRCYPLRSVIRAGIPIALSSDAPVVKDFNPLAGMAAAMQRKDPAGQAIAPQEKITVEEALYAYTMGGARAAGEEKIKGSLTPGKLADLVILDKDPVTGASAQLDSINVSAVYLDGKEVRAASIERGKDSPETLDCHLNDE